MATEEGVLDPWDEAQGAAAQEGSRPPSQEEEVAVVVKEHS